MPAAAAGAKPCPPWCAKPCPPGCANRFRKAPFPAAGAAATGTVPLRLLLLLWWWWWWRCFDADREAADADENSAAAKSARRALEELRISLGHVCFLVVMVGRGGGGDGLLDPEDPEVVL